MNRNIDNRIYGFPAGAQQTTKVEDNGTTNHDKAMRVEGNDTTNHDEATKGVDNDTTKVEDHGTTKHDAEATANTNDNDDEPYVLTSEVESEPGLYCLCVYVKNNVDNKLKLFSFYL